MPGTWDDIKSGRKVWGGTVVPAKGWSNQRAWNRFYGGYELCLNFGKIFIEQESVWFSKSLPQWMLLNEIRKTSIYDQRGFAAVDDTKPEYRKFTACTTIPGSIQKLYWIQMTLKDELIFCDLSASSISTDRVIIKGLWVYSQQSLVYKDSIERDASSKQLNLLDIRYRGVNQINEQSACKRKELQDSG